MKRAHKLNQFFATAICGNNILSSVLYVVGIAILFAGVYAPLILLAAAILLACYKAVYTEVVEALPVNGGAYNTLLNGTQKIVAALAGVLSLLAYLATAVISAKVASDYLATLIPIPPFATTIILLAAMAALLLLGIKDSARVAGGIFVVHLIALCAFFVVGIRALSHGADIFAGNAIRTLAIVSDKGGLAPAFFFAFAASLLGVSGFESSANFVEEQAPGVFRKTLRNMLFGVVIANPLVALIVLHTLPFDAIASAKDFLLSDAALALGGTPFQSFIVLDAFLVLGGAVLSAYVGVTGLAARMAGDACLPSLLGIRNRRGSYPWTIILFFLLGSSVMFITRGNLLSLAGVYTISFLAVFTLVALGNLILKAARPELKRTYRAPTLIVLFAASATAAGIAGNISINRSNLFYFSIYFLPAAALVAFAVYRDYILRFALRMTPTAGMMHRYLQHNFEDIIHGRYVAFVNHTDKLYPMLRYINRNETGREVTIVHCAENPRGSHDRRCTDVARAALWIQKAGVLSHLHLTTICRHAPFGSETILAISRELRIRPNRMFIGSIHPSHPFDYADLHGVRIIF